MDENRKRVLLIAARRRRTTQAGILWPRKRHLTRHFWFSPTIIPLTPAVLSLDLSCSGAPAPSLSRWFD
jgi:hypothetical protein